MGCLVLDRVILSGPRVILFLSGPSHLRARFVLLPCYTPVRLNDVRLEHESARGAELYRVRRKRFMQLLFCSFMTFEKYSRRRFGNTHTAVQDTRMHTAHEATPHTTTNTPRSHCGVVAHSTNYTNSTQRSRLIRGQGTVVLLRACITSTCGGVAGLATTYSLAATRFSSQLLT